LSLGLLLLWQPGRAEAARTVRVGVFPAAPLVQDAGDKPQGLFVDLIEYFATSLDWQIEYVHKPWGELLVALERGEIDLLPAVAVTSERQAIYDYSQNPPFIDSGVVFTGPDFHLHTIFDLQGARVAGVQGSVFTGAFEAYAATFGVKCEIVPVEDNPAVMQAITDGTADAGVCIYSLGLDLEQRYPVSITAISFAPTALSFAVPKGKNADLIAGIDRLMAPMIGDPDSLYSLAFDRWILPSAKASMPSWAWWSIGGLVFLGLAPAFWSFSLRRQVAARTKTLFAEVAERQRTEELLRQSQKMEAVGRLAGGIAHDFNNLLSAIIGYADLVLSNGDELRPDSARADVLEIRSAGERGAALTKQILAFSRRQALKPEVVLLNDVLRDMESLLRRTLGEDMELVIRLDPDLAQVEVDPHQFGQVLMNLAANARDAMPEGGRLIFETSNVGRYVMVSVTDTGVGMDPETVSHVFEPFFTTKSPEKGTGLGLSTVYGIVHQSGGTVEVRSELGEGTTFAVLLPQAVEPKAEASPAAATAGSPRGGETILLVEDEEVLRNLVARVLGGLGYTVLTAADAEEVLEILTGREAPIDLLLSDVVLPGGIQGNDMAAGLLSARPGLLVLFMSGYARDATIHDRHLDEGANFLQKPFTPSELAAKVREVLDSAQR
jgi:signal transduction histidine kinase/ActR/RegA family two-component response regulator